MRIPHLRHTSLQNRLLTGIGVMLLPLVAVSIAAFISLENAVKAFEKTAKEVDKEIVPLTRLQTLIVQASIPADDYLIHGAPSERNRFIHLSDEIDNIFADTLNSATFDMPQEIVFVRSAQN